MREKQSDPARSDIVLIPRKKGLPSHVAEMFRRLYGVELIVKEKETNGDENGDT